MQVRETEAFDTLWQASPIHTCGDNVVTAFENSECYEAACEGTEGYAGLDDFSLFDFPEANAAINMLLWMVCYRLLLFEFNELDSPLHALKRSAWAGLVWRFLQLFITACILIVN